LATVSLFCQLVLQASTSLAGTSAVLSVLWPQREADGEIPHCTTGRTWLLRVGLYKLERPKVRANDWIWLADHVIQIGTEKCLNIVGVRQGELPPPGECLELKHLEPIAILPVSQSNQGIVQEQLERKAAELGAPVAILTDEGHDLLGGVQRFCQSHPETTRFSDITHYGARLLKRRLEKNDRWKDFCRRVGQTKFQTAQTELAFLTPPAQRSKARFMNLGPLLSWAGTTLAVLDERPEAVLQHATGERLEEKFGWLREFRHELATWQEWQDITQATLDVVRREGYGPGVASSVADQSRVQVKSEAGEILQSELVAFVAAQSSKVAEGTRVPGSTEILESSFGRLKSLEGDHQKGGFTHLILAYAALLGETTTELIETAINSTPWKRVKAWCHAHLGSTVQAKRMTTYRAVHPKTAQQNPEET
jgi:hypothetical protein